MFDAMILMTSVIKLKRWKDIHNLSWILSNFYFMQLTMLFIIIGCTTQMNYAIEIPSMPNTTVPKPQPTRTMPSESNSKFKGTNSYHFDDMEIQQNRIYSTKETHLEHKTDGNKLITDTSMNYTPTQAINWNDDHDDDGRFAEVDDLDPFEVFFSGKMKFGTKNSTVVTGQIGGMAYLPCIVHNIGDSVVSWIRRKEYRLLTVGTITYIRDERFGVTHRKHSEDWTLQVKYVNKEDAGWYECQASVHPPASIFVLLHVIEAHAEIIGPPIRYLTPGSMLKLVCRILQNTEISAFMFWYHNNRMINYDIDRGINVSTETEYHHSELIIEHTKTEHSGNYTCVPSNAQPAYVVIHIFKGDQQAAMYHEDWSNSADSCLFHRNFPFVIL